MAEIPKIVSQRLQAADGARVHPDADLITAFVEKSLGSRERVQVLEHLSRCAGCRDVLSLAATQPDMAGAVSVARKSAGWFSWPVLRWGAAVACVMVVGAAVTLRHRQESQQVAPLVSEVKPAGGKPAVGAQTSVPENAFVKMPASLQLSDHEAKTGVVAKQAEQPSQAGASRPAMQSTLVAGASAPSAPSGSYSATAPGPVEMADAGTGSPMAEMVPGRAKAALAESQDAYAQKAVVGGLLKKRSMAANAAQEAALPANLAPRWTLSSDGTLQRSLDSGGTWQTIPVSSKTIFRALAANGLDIWVGGSAGALFHSADAGQHWIQLRPVANGEILADDIIGVEFTDLLHGKLTTSNTETWLTADGGQTWQIQ